MSPTPIRLLMLGLALAAGQAPAAAAAPALTVAPMAAIPTPQPVPQLSANYFVTAALRASAALANGQAGAVYDNGSNVMKAAENRDAFLAQVDGGMARSSRATDRIWRDLNRQFVAGPARQGSPPPGQYVSVTVVAVAGTRASRVETVSFHNDGDGAWRVCGITIKPVSAG